MVFPVVMYECESWTIKKADHQRIYVFELRCWRRLLRVSRTARRSNQSILMEISPEYSLKKTDAEAGAPKLWPPDVMNWLIRKESDAGKDWGQDETRTTEGEMVGWHHRLNVHGFEWTPGVGHWQGGLACCSSGGLKESNTIEQLNWTDSTQSNLWIQCHPYQNNHIIFHRTRTNNTKDPNSQSNPE